MTDKRLVFIDVFRGIAVLWMIETHVVNAFMSASLKNGFFYDLLNLSNGFVAVSFLFCAGAGFYMAASAKWQDYKGFKRPLYLYLRKLGFLLLIAYFLHLPVQSLRELINLNYGQRLVFFQADILQTIVLSSVAALILLFLVPNLKTLTVASSVIAALIFAAAPLVWNMNPLESMPVGIATYLSKPPVSNFPLFPWSGYFFTGLAVTGFFSMSKDRKRFAIYSAVAGVFFLLFNYYTSGYQPLYGFHDWWRASPGHSLFRAGGAIAVFSILYLFETFYRDMKATRFFLLIGMESLFMYTTHLLIVYGSILGQGIKSALAQSLGLYETIIAITGLVILCSAGAYGWNYLKRDNIKSARIIMWGLASAFVIIFGLGLYS